MIQATTEPVRVSKAAVFRLLGYEPHPGQVLVHRSTASRRVLACGVRWGKTMCAAHEAVAALLEPRERSIGWTVGPTYDLSSRCFDLVARIVEDRLRHRVCELDRRGQRVVLTNLGGGASELRGKSADNPTSLLGEGLDWLVVDEAAQLRADVWENYLGPRLLDRKGWALLMSTPNGSGWFHRMFRRGQKGRDPAFESWASPSAANPHLDRAAIEAERQRLPADVFAQEYEAAFLRNYLDPCETCGGPSRDAIGILVLADDSAPQRCPECDLCVDASGRTVVAVWPDGSVHFEILRERGFDWPFGVPDELLQPEVVAADFEARLGPSRKPVYWLTKQEIEWAKAGIPIAQWPGG